MVNKVMLIGNVGKDPEVRENLTTLSLATDDSYKKDGEWVNQTDWHRVVAFGKLAESLSGVTKGMTLYIEGKVKTRSYEANGETKWTTEIHALTYRKIKKNEVAESVETTPAETPEEEDLPF